MEKLCKELDDVKAAMEKLTAENRTKTEVSENLRKAHNEQLVKIKEAKLQIEKQAQELCAKTEEISFMKLEYEETKSNLQEKESALRQLRIAHDKLRADNGEKLKMLEVKNGELISSLDEANTKIQELDQKVHMFKEEVERTKGLLSVSQKKSSEAEQKAHALKDFRQRDDLLMNIEEESMKTKEQLKWKKEQFNHLQEAHEKVQDQFRVSKKEWEKEKCTLIDEISLLQSNLDSQIRISESLQYKLHMCNQALAHEESRRKLLEVQLSESKECFENVFTECQEAKHMIEGFTGQRDGEIATLRNSLGTKETLLKEAEYRREYLEQENEELRASLKEFQEAQIREAGSVSSLTRLRNKLKGLEHVHRECSAKLNARETEWSLQMGIMIGDLEKCRSELEHKDRQVQELEIELENCYSSMMQLKLQNEETFAMHTLYKYGLENANIKSSKPEDENELHGKEVEEKIVHLMKQVEQKNNALVEAHANIEQEQVMAAPLLRKLESFNFVEQKYGLALNELERYKETHEEISVQYRSELEHKDRQIQELQIELENFHSSMMQLKLQNEETFAMHTLYKSGLADASLKFSKSEEENELHRKEVEEKTVYLMEQLEQKNNALVKAHADTEQEKVMAASLLRKLESFNFVEQKFGLTLNELEKYKETHEELSVQHRAELERKDRQIQELQIELGNCHSSMTQLKLQNEETFVMHTLYKSRLADANLKFSKSEEENELHRKELEEKIVYLMEQLEQKNNALVKAHADIEQEQVMAASLLRKLESLNFLEQKYELTLNELEKYKEMLEESSVQYIRLKEQALQTEIALKEDLKKLSDALDNVNAELAEKLQEENEVEFELERWKSSVESMQRCLDENQGFRKEMENSLLAQVETEQTLKQEKEDLLHLVEEKDRRADGLQQKIVLLEQEFLRREAEISSLARMETQNEFELEKEKFLQIVEEKDKSINDLKQRIDMMEQDFMRRELDAMRRELEAAIFVQIKTEKSMEKEKERLLEVVENRDNTIENLRLQMKEQDEDCEKFLTSQVLAELEAQMKSFVIRELEKEITCLVHKLELHDESMPCTKVQVEQLEAAVEAKQLEMETVINKLESKLRTSEESVTKLQSEKRILIQEVAKLSSDRGDLLDVIGGFSEQMSGFSTKDMELMGRLGKIVESFNSQNELVVCEKGCFELYDSNVECENSFHSFPAPKNTQVILPGRRFPLIERNN